MIYLVFVLHQKISFHLFIIVITIKNVHKISPQINIPIYTKLICLSLYPTTPQQPP